MLLGFESIRESKRRPHITKTHPRRESNRPTFVPRDVGRVHSRPPAIGHQVEPPSKSKVADEGWDTFPRATCLPADARRLNAKPQLRRLLCEHHCSTQRQHACRGVQQRFRRWIGVDSAVVPCSAAARCSQSTLQAQSAGTSAAVASRPGDEFSRRSPILPRPTRQSPSNWQYSDNRDSLPSRYNT